MQALSAEWIFPVSSPPLHRHSIEFENGIIKALRPSRPDDPFINGACLLPGLVNAHTHLAYTALRNQFDNLPFFAWIRRLTELKYKVLRPEDLANSAKLGILECLRNGITTVADLSDCEPALAELSRSPLRGVFYWEVFGVEKQQAEESWNSLQTVFPELQTRYSTQRLNIGISPHACYTVRPELYSRIADWAGKNSLKVSFHIAESREEELFIASRKGPIAAFLTERVSDWNVLGNTSTSHLEATGILQTRPLLAHAVQVSDGDIEILARQQTRIAHCPKSNAKFAHGVAPLSKLLDAGLRTGLGTDSAASNNRLDLFEEARFSLLQQRATTQDLRIDESLVLEMMTLGGAKAMDLDDQIGSLEPGKYADFIAVSIPEYYASADQVLRHIVHNATGSDVLSSWIGGEPISTTLLDEEIAGIYKRCTPS